MTDKQLTCVNPKCETGTFLWTAGEQKFLARLVANGKITEVIEPKRCPDCRKKRKEHLTRKAQQ